jgi:hypothetical protein
MPGRIKHAIDLILQKKGKGNQALITLTRMKLGLKGIDPDAFSDSSHDDPRMLAKIEAIAAELGVVL